MSSDPTIASTEQTRIEGGIEWFDLGEGRSGEACARCGSSADFLRCWNCGGDGMVESDDWQDFGEDEECRECRGHGGEWHCVSSPEYCNANPIAGREHIQSTALRSEAWND